MPDQLLDTLEPGGRDTARAMVRMLRGYGIQTEVISGRRSVETNRRAGGAKSSRHLTGQAFDLQLGGIPVRDVNPAFWAALGDAWEKAGGRWGGRFNDPNHFDWG